MSQDKGDLTENQEYDQYRNEPSSQYSRLGSSQPDYLTSSQYDNLDDNPSPPRWYSQSDSHQIEDNVTASQNEGWQNSNWYSQPNSQQYLGNNSQDSFWASSQQSGITSFPFFSFFKLSVFKFF